MATNGLPSNLTALIDHISSVSQLETLLLLRRYSDRDWTAREVANELYTNDTAALRMLTDLSSFGLLQCFKRNEVTFFTYDQENEELESHVAALYAAYRISRTKVIDCIYRKPDSTP